MQRERRKIFGADGVRGRANEFPMDSESVLLIGRALATVLRNGDHRHRVVVGKDTRLSGYMIETALASGISSMGVDVMLVGPLPTPAIAFIARSMRADAGAVISASHSDFSCNGIKFFDKDGFKFPVSLENRIEEVFFTVKEIARPTGSDIGRAHRIDDAAGRYIQFLKSTFPAELTLEGLRLVVDSANGAGYSVAPLVFEELGAEVIELGSEPNGLNINDGVGSLAPHRMCELVKQMGANAGISLDGDADRVTMCDEKGNIVDGDVMMALAAEDLLQSGNLSKNTLVATVMSNTGLDRAMKKLGVKVIRVKVGDRHVIDEMRSGGFNLGGEQSGHIVFLDHNTTGDGIMGALKILTVMCRKQKPLSQISNVFEPYPQVRLNVKVSKMREFTTIPDIVHAMESFTKELGAKGRLLVRFSGTENVARVLVEGSDPCRIRSMADDLAGLIKTHMGAPTTTI